MPQATLLKNWQVPRNVLVDSIVPMIDTMLGDLVPDKGHCHFVFVSGLPDLC